MQSAASGLQTYKHIVLFTGAGMSAESGVPTYRGSGGIWSSYRWQEYACQAAFDRNPQKVIQFHEIRRQAVLRCQPHAGHRVMAGMQRAHPQRVQIVTQNIDGMHQRAGARM
jgi:NAD-dependent deacetylase